MHHAELKLATVVNTAETYVCTHFFSGDRAKNDQLRVLGKFREQSLKRVAISELYVNWKANSGPGGGEKLKPVYFSFSEL
jgi:hypothetical protein